MEGGSLVPEPLRQQLQQLIDSQTAVVRDVVAFLPADLARFAQTPDGLLALFCTVALLAVLAWVAAAGGARKRGGAVVIAGPPNAGKSTLFFQLVDGSEHNGLVASMQENAATASVAAGKGAPRQARLIDVPGHHSFRHRLEAALRDAAGVVFVVDAVEITPHRIEAAEMLYEVLTNAAFQKRRTPLLVACNKADLEEDAHSVEFIRKTLEKQLDAMRRTKAAGIGKDSGAAAPALGAPDKPLSLLGGLRGRVAIAECSAKKGQLDEVKSFIRSCL